MAWFRNHYHCGDCDTKWEDEWSCCCDDECPNCGSKNWSPYESDDMTEVVCESDRGYDVYRSPEKADDRPRYQFIASFQSADLAARFVRDGDLT
jgi:hypothetical protein